MCSAPPCSRRVPCRQVVDAKLRNANSGETSRALVNRLMTLAVDLALQGSSSLWAQSQNSQKGLLYVLIDFT